MEPWLNSDAALSVPLASDFADRRLARLRSDRQELPPTTNDSGLDTAAVTQSTASRVRHRQLEQTDVVAVTATPSSRLSTAVVFAKEHLAVIGVVCAVAAAFAVTQLFGARTIEVPLTTATVVDEPNKTALSSTAPPTIAVHVLGAVVNPGVVVLPENARVQEAILACGGLAADAEPAELNFAQVLFDGEQLVIGTRNNPRGEVNGNSSGGTAAKTTSGSATGSRLNLNAATQAQLETLPGVGPVTAGRIIAWREQHGRFSTTAELQEVSGIGVKTYAQLEPYVSV